MMESLVYLSVSVTTTTLTRATSTSTSAAYLRQTMIANHGDASISILMDIGEGARLLRDLGGII